MHTCTLKKTRGRASQLKNWLRSTNLASLKLPSCKRFFKTYANVREEQRRHSMSRYFYILHPYSEMRFIWEVITFTAIIISFLILPFNAWFIDNESHHYIVNTFICLFCSVICLCDVVLNFFTGYIKVKTKEIILDHPKIVKHYLKTYFIIDIFSSLPAEGLHLLMDIDYFELQGTKYSLLKIFPFLAILRLRRMVIYLMDSVSALNVTGYKFNGLMISIYAILFFHWTACIHFMLPLYIADWEFSQLPEASWIRYESLENETDVNRYITCLFRAVSSNMGVGYGEPHETTLLESSIIIVTRTFSLLTYIYMLVILLISNEAVSSPTIKHMTFLDAVKEFMKRRQLSSETQFATFYYLDYIFRGRFFREDFILRSMPPALRLDILFHKCSGMMTKTGLFENVSVEDKKKVSVVLERIVYLPGDLIIRAGLQGDGIYFLDIGTAVITTATGEIISKVEDGSVLGEVEMLTNMKTCAANVTAVTTCDIYYLSRKHISILESAEPLFKELHEQAVKKLHDMKKAKIVN